MPSRMIGSPTAVTSSSQRLLGLFLLKSKCSAATKVMMNRSSSSLHRLLPSLMDSDNKSSRILLASSRSSWRWFSSSTDPTPLKTSHEKTTTTTTTPSFGSTTHTAKNRILRLSCPSSSSSVEDDSAAAVLARAAEEEEEDERRRSHDHVLDAVALEAEQLLANVQILRSSSSSKSEQQPHPHHRALLEEAVDCLMDISWQPDLLAAMQRTSCSTTASASHQNCSLVLHRAFVTVLSAAVDAVMQDINNNHDNDDDLLEQVIQLTRLAQSLHLPLHVPYYKKLALVVATHEAGAAIATSSFSTSARLLVIAKWHSQQQQTLGGTDSRLELPQEAIKLSFLVEALKILIQRRKYGIVLDVVEDLVHGNTNLESEEIVDLDFHVVFDIFVLFKKMSREYPQDLTEIQQIVMLLEPPVFKFLKENKALIQPKVLAFLARFFLEDTNDDDEDDPDEVWDPFIMDLILNDKTMTTEERLAALPDFYTRVSMAIDAKVLQVTRILPRSQTTTTTSSEEDDDDSTDWSSDEENADDSDGETALRRHHMYLRGRGRPMDALYFPDITLQAIKLNRGLNLRFTDQYEELIWKRDFQDSDDDDVSSVTLDSDDEPYSDSDGDEGDTF